MSEESNNPNTVTVFYYAAIDPETRIVQCCYPLFSPATAENFVKISQSDYEKFSTLPGAKVDGNGALVPYQPPISKEGFKSMAAYSLQAVQSQAVMITAMGKVFGPEMRSYVEQLQAIIDGADTTSTTLPTAPADPTT